MDPGDEAEAELAQQGPSEGGEEKCKSEKQCDGRTRGKENRCEVGKEDIQGGCGEGERNQSQGSPSPKEVGSKAESRQSAECEGAETTSAT